MKHRINHSIAGFTAVLALFTATTGDLKAQSISSTTKGGTLVTPRMVEEHPELSFWRSRPSVEELRARESRMEKQLARITENRAVATSPRTLEQYPELLRPAVSVEQLRAQTARREAELAKVAKNRAVAASPRTIELFPELARGWKPSSEQENGFHLAPLK